MENTFEKLLNIKTSGKQNLEEATLHYNRYEPTSYIALETLLLNYEIKENDNLIDFGCGKGRLNFYLSYKTNANVLGIEMNHFFYDNSLANKKSFLKNHKKDKNKINFLNTMAQDYSIEKDDNKFYFFNPFSVQIFSTIINNILLSVEENPRTVDLILYYPSDDYIYYLENNTAFYLEKEIRVPLLDKNDFRQIFSIYRYLS